MESLVVKTDLNPKRCMLPNSISMRHSMLFLVDSAVNWVPDSLKGWGRYGSDEEEIGNAITN